MAIFLLADMLEENLKMYPPSSQTKDVRFDTILELYEQSADLGFVYATRRKTSAKLNLKNKKTLSFDRYLEILQIALDFDDNDIIGLRYLYDYLKIHLTEEFNFNKICQLFQKNSALLEKIIFKISQCANKHRLILTPEKYFVLYKVIESFRCEIIKKLIRPFEYKNKFFCDKQLNSSSNLVELASQTAAKGSDQIYTKWDFDVSSIPSSFEGKSALINEVAQKDFEGAFLVSLQSIEFNRDEEWDLFVFHFLHKMAERGVVQAQCHLGLMYFSGIWVTQDFAAAAEWLEKAINAEMPLAQYLLGYMYYNGLGLKEDLKKAAFLFSLAENKELQIKIGKEPTMYMRQVGARLGCTRIVKEIEKQANITKSPYLFYLLGTMSKLGDGLEKNIENSFTYFKKSYSKKSVKGKSGAIAKYEMAKILKEEKFSVGEQYSWKKLLQQSVDANFPNAITLNLVEYLKDTNECNGDIYQTLLNHAEAYEDGLAYYTLGKVSKERNADISQAIAFYKKAAELNNRDAQFVLSLGPTYGNNNEWLQHKNEMAEYVKYAAQNGHPVAMKKRLNMLKTKNVQDPQVKSEIDTLTYRLDYIGEEKVTL